MPFPIRIKNKKYVIIGLGTFLINDVFRYGAIRCWNKVKLFFYKILYGLIQRFIIDLCPVCRHSPITSIKANFLIDTVMDDVHSNVAFVADSFMCFIF